MADETTTYQMTNARPENYWIAPDAFYITLNAMGQPDYLQGNVSSGAVIMCYMRGIDGLSFDAGHNYRRWPLAVAPTYFNTSTPKYVYAAIPKSEAVNAYAQIVYPSEKIDLYGKNAKGEQIGTEGYYFVFLQGIISASVATDGTTQMRSWTQRVDCGSLASDEAIAAGGTDAWWKYSSVDDTVIFIKTIAKAVFDNITAKIATISKLILNGHEINGVATKDTPATSDDTLVTPKYIKDVGDSKYLRKDQNDSTKFTLGMNVAEIKDRAKSDNFDNHVGFPFGTGWAAIKDDGSGASMLEVDKLFVRMKAYFAELEIRKISYVGGNYVFSSAGGTIYYVEWLDANKKVLEKTDDNRYLIDTFRCYLYSDDGTTKTMNWFKEDDQVRCQNFGDLTKTAKTVDGVITATDCTTHYWWRRVNKVDSGVIAAKGDGKNYEYVDFQNVEGQYGAGSDFPEEGDVMVQFGNWTTAERQGVIMIVVTGDDAPAIIEWQNVGANNQHFTIPDKAYTRISPRGEGNIFRGKFFSVSGTTTDHTGESLDEQISALVDQLNDIKNQADKKFDIWFNGGEPHPNSAEDKTANAPASDWTTDAEKGLHAQDLYYDTDKDPASNGGRAWRWMAHNTDGNVAYYWDKVTDADTIAALDKARDVQNQVNDIASDGIISHGSEKSQLLIEWNKTLANYQKYSALAKTYALEWSTYYTNFFKLAVMLNGGQSYTDDNVESGTTPSWLSDDLGKDTAVNASTYRSTWKAYNDAFAALLKSLSDKTKGLVDAAQTSADEKVQTFVSTSDDDHPQPPYKKGDFWIQTDKDNNDNNVLICISGSTGSYSSDDWTDLSDLVSSTDVRTILATLADKVYALVWDDYLGKSGTQYVDVYIGSQPSSAYDYDLSYYKGVLYKRNSSWQEVSGSGFESTFATVLSILGTIRIRVSNHIRTSSQGAKQYDLALTQISIKDPVDDKKTMGTCEIEMYNENGAWEVLRTCTLAIMKNYGDHIVSVVKGIQDDVSEISGSYVTQGTFDAFSQRITTETDANGNWIVTNIQKSGLLTTADGNLLYAMSQSNTVNMLMGTTTGVGWTKETTCAKSDYTFNADKREFTIINYFPKFRAGYEFTETEDSDNISVATLKSPIVRIVRGQKYIVSFQLSSVDERIISDNKINFNVCLRYGTSTECVVNGDTKFFAWSNKIDESAGKREYVIIRSSSDPNRYYIIFEASNNYDYIQVLFINAVARCDTSSSKQILNSVTFNKAWPYSSTSNQTLSSNATISEDDTKKETVVTFDAYTGSSTQYSEETDKYTESVLPISMSVSKIQMEQAVRDTIADIEPSEYKESQNAIESYIKQTADSITIHASQIHLEGYTTINKGFSIDEHGNMTANNAKINGGRLLISKNDCSVAIETLEDEPGGIITARNGSQIGIRLGISKQGSSIYKDIASAFTSETIAKNVVNGPALMMGFYHGGGGSTYSFLSSNFFYNQHIDSQYMQTGGLSISSFIVDDGAGSYNNQPSLADVDTVITKHPARFPSVLVFKNTNAKTFELGDPNEKDSLGLIKNYGRFLFCWHMGGDITFTASVSGKGIRTKSGNGYKDVTSFKSTAMMELVMFYSDGSHWLLTTHNTSMV